MKIIELLHPNKKDMIRLEISEVDEINVDRIIDRVNDWFYEDFPIPDDDSYFKKVKEKLDENNIKYVEKCEFYNLDGTCAGTPYGQCLHMDLDMNRKCRADEGWERNDDEEE